jgi:SAM-dependent methyltransferase
MNKISVEIRVWLARITTILIDSIRGLDFVIPINTEKVGLDPNISFRSSPSGNRYLLNIFSNLNITAEDSIVDIGCGKGSAIRTMLKYSFRNVDGIELSDIIAKIAINNFARLRENRVKIYNVNAVEFDGYSSYNYYYFANPFPSSVMQQVIKSIEESVMSSNRKVSILYDNPTCHSEIIKNGVFKKIAEYPDEWNNKYYLYTNQNGV